MSPTVSLSADIQVAIERQVMLILFSIARLDSTAINM